MGSGGGGDGGDGSETAGMGPSGQATAVAGANDAPGTAGVGAGQDAAAEGVGGGTGIGGVDDYGAFESMVAANAQAEENAFGGGMHTNTQALGAPPGAPGYDPNASFMQNMMNVSLEMSPELNPNPTNFGRAITGLVSPVFGGLTLAGTIANAAGAAPGTDVDAYGADIGDVGTGVGDAGGGSQGAGGQANDYPQTATNPLTGLPQGSTSLLGPSPSMLAPWPASSQSNFTPRYPPGGIMMTDPLPSPIPGYGTLMRGYRG